MVAPLALLALFPLVASAQQVHLITVGDANGDLTFSPEAIAANVGDTVSFEFHQKNHSVVQSSFASPCGPADGGFNSGFFPIDPSTTSDFPTYNITVQDTKPIWVYCGQKNPKPHCHAGMVFAVNCGQDGSPNSFTNFKNSALALAAQDSSSAAAPAATPSGSPTYGTAADGSTYTVPPAPEVAQATATVSVDGSVWTTTYGSYPNSPAPTPDSLQGSVIKVLVGDNGTLTFNPPMVQAKPRDTIVFEFRTKNHTVTQSSFADPCRKLSLTNSSATAFDSGFMPVPAGATEFPLYNVTVNDTAPIWVYCKQTNPAVHCGAGMVFAINSDESSARSSSAFASLAKQINGTQSDASSGSSGSSGNTTTAGSGSSGHNGASQVTFGATGLLALAAVFVTLL